MEKQPAAIEVRGARAQFEEYLNVSYWNPHGNGRTGLRSLHCVHSPVLYDYRVKSSSQNVYASMRKMRKSRKTSLMEFTPFVASLQIFHTFSVLFMIQ